MATYGPGIDLSQHAKSVSHIIKLIIHLSIGEKPNISTPLHSRLDQYPGLFTSTSGNNC